MRLPKRTEKAIDSYVERVAKRADVDFNKVINPINDELHEEAWRMYDSFIDQFYSYETTSYIRHGETKPGTRHGINLYRGQQIKKISGNNPKLIVQFNSSDMEGGYQYNSPSEVLESVMTGIRFPYKEQTWQGSYSGKYFSYKGTPANAFDVFNRYYDDIVEELFYPRWRKLGY